MSFNAEDLPATTFDSMLDMTLALQREGPVKPRGTTQLKSGLQIRRLFIRTHKCAYIRHDNVVET